MHLFLRLNLLISNVPVLGVFFVLIEFYSKLSVLCFTILYVSV